MALTDILFAQLTDPFRIGLVVALVLTMLRTAAVTGRWIPLAAGVFFVAFMIPMTMSQMAGEPLWRLVAVGIVANLVILAAVMAVRALVLRFR